MFKSAPATSPVTLMLPPPMLPVTDRAVKVPTLVMFVCVPVANRPEMFVDVNVSVSLSKVKFVSAPKSPPSLKIT